MVGGEEVVDARLRDLAEPGVADLLATIFPVDGSEMWITRPGVFSRGLLPGSSQSLVGGVWTPGGSPSMAAG